MMEYKTVLQNFKENLKEGGSFSFGLFESLFLFLRQNGATQSVVTKEFVDDLNRLFFLNQPTGLFILSLEYCKYYSKIILPKEQAMSAKKTEEGDLEDGLFTPPDQIISIDKSKLPDKQLDREFLNELGAIGIQDE